jgi:energy-coupling factor transporter ATP-binding protein EcfA2
MINELSVVSGSSITVNDFNSLVVLGDNGVGKTSFIEKVALVNEDNLEAMVKARGYVRYKGFSVTIDGDKVECEEAGGERYFIGQIIPSSSYTYICNGHVRYKVMIFYPYTFITAVHDYYYDVLIKPKDEDIEFSKSINDFIDGVVIRSSNDFLYRKGDFITYLDNLGSGISSAVKFMWFVYHYKPDILLVDNIESLHLHPLRFEKLFKWLSSRGLKGFIFTTNSDAYVTLAELDTNSKFLLLKKGGYVVMDNRDVLNYIDYEDLRYTSVKW